MRRIGGNWNPATLSIIVLVALALAAVPVLPQPEPPIAGGKTEPPTAGGKPAAWPDGNPAYIQLVAVQMRWSIDDYATPERFAARVDGLMRRAARRLDPRYPALVVFPEDAGILTVFTGEAEHAKGVTTLEGAVERMVRAHLPAVLWNRATRRAGWVRGIFLARQETMGRTYLETFSAAARKYGVYLVAGSAPLPDYDLPAGGGLPHRYRPRGGAVYNVSYFFGPDGRILGRQKKVHLIDIEGPAGLDLTPGRVADLRVFDTPLGRVGIAICLDAFQPDVVNRLQALGAQILVQPSANPAPWSPAQQADWLNGAWQAVAGRGDFAYAVNPMMTGQVLNLGFFGQSAIISRQAARCRGCGPRHGNPTDSGTGALGYPAVGPRPGFVAVADTADGEAVLVTKVPRP